MLSNLKRSALVTAAVIAAAIMTGCQNNMACCQLELGYETTPGLMPKDVTLILDQGEQAAMTEESLLRVDADGKPQTTRMHIFVVDREGNFVGRRSMDDAWAGSVSIAKAKAFTAMAFSSDENALTSRSIGELSQPGGPLWQIGNSNKMPGLIEFPGGVPLYVHGKLVGAVGVSGDGVEQDENVAQAAAKGYDAPKPIRIDTVTSDGVSYTK